VDFVGILLISHPFFNIFPLQNQPLLRQALDSKKFIQDFRNSLSSGDSCQFTAALIIRLASNRARKVEIVVSLTVQNLNVPLRRGYQIITTVMLLHAHACLIT